MVLHPVQAISDNDPSMSDASEGIRSERDGPVAVVTIDRPAQRNALSDPVLALLVDTLEELDGDDTCRCIVLAGSDKVFASGADVRSLLERTPLEAYEGDRAQRWAAIRRLRTPLVAGVSGFCLGGGCELALIADLVVASETARFGLPETRLGLVPGAGGTQLLPRAVGKAVAMDMVLTGRLLSADEAAQFGLVARVTAADAWLATAREVAAAIASRTAVAQRLAKGAIDEAFETPLQAGIAAERRAFAIAFASSDGREGLEAFVEKREPVWRHG
jgi:enoyl-CoA hydratase